MSADLSTAMARRDYAYFTWCAVRTTLKAAADASTIPADQLHTHCQLSRYYFRALMNGQRRLTVETFTLIAVSLGLNPAVVFANALQSAAEALASTTVAA